MLTRLLILTTLMLTTSASACMCWLEPAEASRARAAALFDGVVVAKRVVLHDDPSMGFHVVNEYEFAAIRLWKGQPERRILIRGGSACANEFSAGRRYVVYAARGHDGTLMNMPCGPTGSFDAYSKSGNLEQYFGAPLARFDAPASLPGATAAAWYTQRAHLVAGFGLLARLTDERDSYTDDVRTASTGIAVAGILATVVLLIGVATNFRRWKRSLLLLVIAGITAVATIGVAGQVYLSHPSNSMYLHWQQPPGADP